MKIDSQPPRLQASMSEPAIQASFVEEKFCKVFKGLHGSLLLIAGDSMHTELVRMVLKSAEYVLEEFTSAEKNSGALNRQAPSLVLLDWDTDGVDGEAVLRGLRNDLHTRYVPVIVMTNRTISPRWRTELCRLEVSWILEKPIVAMSLPRLIERTISARAAGVPCQVQRSALLVECGQSASALLKCVSRD